MVPPAVAEIIPMTAVATRERSALRELSKCMLHYVAMDKRRCREIREAMGLTQTEFGRLLGVARNTVTRWEIALSNIPSPTALAIEGLYREWLARRGDQRKRR
jgi:DNA-binding transcriptional regulator YiaG